MAFFGILLEGFAKFLNSLEKNISEFFQESAVEKRLYEYETHFTYPTNTDSDLHRTSGKAAGNSGSIHPCAFAH